jgi:hypothetical protein
MNVHFISTLPDMKFLFDDLKDTVIQDDSEFLKFIRNYQKGPYRAETNSLFKLWMEKLEKACLQKELELEERCNAQGIET